MIISENNIFSRFLRRFKRVSRYCPNKSFLYKIWMTIYTSYEFDIIINTGFKIIKFFENIKKLIEFLPYVWEHQDWHYYYILKFNYYLHKRLYEDYTKNLNLKKLPTEYKKSVKRLLTITLLYKRLWLDEYGNYLKKETDRLFLKGREFFIFKINDKKGYRKYLKYINEQDKFIKKQIDQDFYLIYKLNSKHSNKWLDY